MKDVISTPHGPKAIGPYSQAIRANGFIFVSGQIALDPATGPDRRRRCRATNRSRNEESEGNR